MANEFDGQLKTELTRIQAEITRLETRQRLIQELLGESGGAAKQAAPQPRRRAARRTGPRAAAAPAKRQRRPRGLITGKVREFLNQQTEPVHATEILAFLERNDAAPQSAKPMPTLQSTLQRMKEMGEIENTGRNRWALLSLRSGGEAPSPAASAAPSAPAPRADGPPVVTSTTTFGSRPPAAQ